MGVSLLIKTHIISKKSSRKIYEVNMTYISSVQLSGLSIRLPSKRKSSRSLSFDVGYGKPPDTWKIQKYISSHVIPTQNIIFKETRLDHHIIRFQAILEKCKRVCSSRTGESKKYAQIRLGTEWSSNGIQ